jgi:ATP-binding cassette subfamily B protein
MKNLGSLNKYFVKYKWRLLLGLVFVAVSSKFAEMPGSVVRNVLDEVKDKMGQHVSNSEIISLVLVQGLSLLGLALLRGFFMYLSRQTLIVMSNCRVGIW